jgi:hypothetical protein
MDIGYWWERQKEIDHQEEIDVPAMEELKWILDRMGWYELDCSGSG